MVVQCSCELTVLNPDPKMSYVIVTILVISILTLHTNTLYAILDSSTGIRLIQLNDNDSSVSSDSSNAPSLHSYRSDNTTANTNTNNSTSTNNNPPSEESKSSKLNGGGGLDRSTHDINSNKKNDHDHNDVTVRDDSGNDNHQKHNKHNEHALKNKNKQKLKVGDIPFP